MGVDCLMVSLDVHITRLSLLLLWACAVNDGRMSDIVSVLPGMLPLLFLWSCAVNDDRMSYIIPMHIGRLPLLLFWNCAVNAAGSLTLLLALSMVVGLIVWLI